MPVFGHGYPVTTVQTYSVSPNFLLSIYFLNL